MEYDCSMIFVESNVELCNLKRCKSSNDFFLRVRAQTHTPSRHLRFANPRMFSQRTHLHAFWRDAIFMLVFVMTMLGWMQPAIAQVFLPRYSDYTSNFEWHNPDSLDPEGLNVCRRDRLASALDVLPRRKILNDCEGLNVFNPATCRAFREGRITINALFIHVNVVECCPGWLHSHNLCTQRCPPGTYGAGCRLTCQCGGNIQLGCHHVTGECFCPTGLTGKVCETTCAVAKNSYGLSCSRTCPVCNNGGVCDPVSGECLCPRGWSGMTCTRRCRGGNCPIDCSLCDNESACDKERGKCLCNPGWRGRYCTQPCPDGTFGPDCSQICTCLNKGLCLPEDGSCVCPTGWIGAHCETACPESYYGDQCELRCDCPDGRCDPFTGECIFCPKGRIGPSCITECPAGTYGRKCTKKCACATNLDCDPVSGACFQIRVIPTTASVISDVNTTTTDVTVTTAKETNITASKAEDKGILKTHKDNNDGIIPPQFIPIFPAMQTEKPVTQKPSGMKTQIVVGTSLGGVLVLAVLLTIAFIWIVFQRRDSSKSAKTIVERHQNKNNNTETPNPSKNTPPPVQKPKLPSTPKPTLPIRPMRVAQRPKYFRRSLASFRKEPVYETISPDQLEKEIVTRSRSKSFHSYCDPTSTDFNNPFYCKSTVSSAPCSVRRSIPTSVSRTTTVHSAPGTTKAKHLGREYEVPNCENIELENRTRIKTVQAPSVSGYIELSGEFREPENLYIGLLSQK